MVKRGSPVSPRKSGSGKPYKKPRLTEYGPVEKLTRSGGPSTGVDVPSSMKSAG